MNGMYYQISSLPRSPGLRKIPEGGPSVVSLMVDVLCAGPLG